MAAVSNLSMTQTSANSRRVTWDSSEGGSYWVWVNGVLLTARKMTWVDVVARPLEPVAIEVFDSESDRPGLAYPAYGTLGWDNPLVKGSPIAAAYYRIDQYVDSAWVERATVEDVGLMYYTWPTGILADCETTVWRITPVAASGAEGLALEFNLLMVRKPDPPAATYTLGAAGVVTVG